MGFFMVIAMLYIGIRYCYRQRPILLDIGCLSWYRSNPNNDDDDDDDVLTGGRCQ